MVSALALTLFAAAPAQSVFVLPEATLEVIIFHSADRKVEAAAVKALAAFKAAGGKGMAVADAATQVPPMSDKDLEFAGDGLSADQRKVFKSRERAVTVQLTYPSLNPSALKSADEAVAAAAKATQGFIFDVREFKIYTAEQWRQRRLDEWTAEYPTASMQFSVHQVSEDDGTVTLDTAGLGRFGLNDLLIEDAHRSSANSLTELINVIVQSVVEGRRESGGSLSVDVRAIKNDRARQRWLASSYGNAEGKLAGVLLKPVKRDGETLIAVDFPMSFGPEPSQRYDRAVTLLFGAKDSVKTVEHDDAVLAASARARKTLLNKYKPVAQKGIPLGERLLVKAPFKYAEGNEWMWVDVLRWEGKTITGRLENEPELATQVKAGQTVRIAEDDLFDYMYSFDDGSFYGNEVGLVMAPEMFVKEANGRLRVKEQ